LSKDVNPFAKGLWFVNLYFYGRPHFLKTTRLLDNCFKYLESSPFLGPNIKRLKGALEGSYRYQIGGTRIIYSIDIESRKVFIESIGPRGDVYK